MKKRLIIFVISLMALIIFYGCRHSRDSVYIDPNQEKIITERETVVDGQGRVPAVVFPSGATFAGSEENTLTPGIKVRITEQEVRHLKKCCLQLCHKI